MADKTYNTTDQKDKTNSFLLNNTASEIVKSEAVETLIEEGGESFFNYVDRLGLAEEPDLIVLSSQHHYYYDPEEMNNCKTVINLKELNLVKNVKELLQSCLNFLPQKSNFIGCFTDNEKINGYELRHRSKGDKIKNRDNVENGITSGFPFLNLLYSIMDLKTIRYMSKYSITLLLENYGFKVMDMTEKNGLTYFHAQRAAGTLN